MRAVVCSCTGTVDRAATDAIQVLIPETTMKSEWIYENKYVSIPRQVSFSLRALLSLLKVYRTQRPCLLPRCVSVLV